VRPRQRYVDWLADFDRDGRAADLRPAMAPVVLDVRVLPLNAGDERERIDGRFEVRWPDETEPSGTDIWHVIHIQEGRLGPAQYICSRCRPNPGDSRQPDDGREGFCPEVRAVLAWKAARA